MNKISIFFLSLLLSSCQLSDSISISELIIISVILLIVFGILFYFINKKRKKTDASLTSFSLTIQDMLNRLETTEDKLVALNQLIDRINKDPKYQKTPDWKNSVLVKVYEFIAKEHYKTNNQKGIVETCTKIIELDPSKGMCYYNRGTIYSDWGQHEDALADFKDALLIMPNYANIYNNRGLVFNKLQQYDNALRDFDRAIELLPTAISYFNRANLYVELEKYLKAKADYQKYLELDTEDQNGLTECVIDAIDHLDKKIIESQK